MIGRVVMLEGARAQAGDQAFQEICRDVLGGHTAKVVRGGETDLYSKVDNLIAKHTRRGRRLVEGHLPVSPGSAEPSKPPGAARHSRGGSRNKGNGRLEQATLDKASGKGYDHDAS